jgi:hypothetical protein
MNIQFQHYPGLFCLCFLAIVFLQSGLDKVFNYSTELGYIRQKFSHSALHDYIGAIFLILTLSEVISGLIAIAGIIQLFFTGVTTFAMYAAWVSCVTMLMLIFGQRLTKDYSGAAVLVPYFIVAVMGLFFLS